MKKITVYFKSRSTGAVYKTERHRNGSITCWCPGAVYSGNCWHREQAAKWKGSTEAGRQLQGTK